MLKSQFNQCRFFINKNCIIFSLWPIKLTPDTNIIFPKKVFFLMQYVCTVLIQLKVEQN